MRVLVVEDEPDVSAVFRDFLIELGHEAVLVRSAEAALPALDHERPDAIILDVHLPGLSGLDFLQLPPVRDSGLPVIAVSGVATESQARECLRLGAFDFLGKPVAFDRLGEVLVSFTLPDGGPPVRVNSLVLRIDRSGHAFYFVNLTAQDFERLGEFSRRHLTL